MGIQSNDKIAAIKNVEGLKKKIFLMNLKAEWAEVITCINSYKSTTIGKNLHNTTTSTGEDVE